MLENESASNALLVELTQVLTGIVNKKKLSAMPTTIHLNFNSYQQKLEIVLMRRAVLEDQIARVGVIFTRFSTMGGKEHNPWRERHTALRVNMLKPNIDRFN
jgi:hypothetical protein